MLHEGVLDPLSSSWQGQLWLEQAVELTSANQQVQHDGGLYFYPYPTIKKIISVQK